jgi:hypothetical protein
MLRGCGSQCCRNTVAFVVPILTSIHAWGITIIIVVVVLRQNLILGMLCEASPPLGVVIIVVR